MRNRYKGKCYVCKKTVKVGAGFFERTLGGWIVRHAECSKPAQPVIKQEPVNLYHAKGATD